MEAVLLSWLAVAALTPFVGILSAWTVVVFCSYRKQWRLVDVFLFAVTMYEVVYSLFSFCFSVLSIIRPVADTPCSFVIWGLTSGRTFHLSAITSLLLDRALSSRWPYSYRYSVRRSQVRYHLVVLGIISLFVGVTAVFARSPTSGHGACSLHPLAWDFKFSVFFASIYAMLLLIGLFCSAVAIMSPNPDSPEKFSPVPSWESGRSSSSSNNSKNLKQEWKEHNRHEWRTVAAVCWISYGTNHGPFVVLTFLGIVAPSFWSSWLDNSTVWMSLAQGSLVPLMLLVADLPHRSAVKNMLRKQCRTYRNLSDQRGFLPRYPQTQRGAKKGLPPQLVFPPARCLPLHNPFHVPQRIRWSHNALPSLQSFNQEKSHSPVFLCPSDAGSTSKESLRCVSPALYNHELYASLDSSCYTLLSFRSQSSAMSSLNSATERESADGISITTNALDDFEFHGTPPTTDITSHMDRIFVFNKVSSDDQRRFVDDGRDCVGQSQPTKKPYCNRLQKKGDLKQTEQPAGMRGQMKRLQPSAWIKHSDSTGSTSQIRSPSTRLRELRIPPSFTSFLPPPYQESPVSTSSADPDSSFLVHSPEEICKTDEEVALNDCNRFKKTVAEDILTSLTRNISGFSSQCTLEDPTGREIIYSEYF